MPRMDTVAGPFCAIRHDDNGGHIVPTRRKRGRARDLAPFALDRAWEIVLAIGDDQLLGQEIDHDFTD